MNTAVTFNFGLKTIQSYTGDSGIYFGNTFNLATTGDVFTILGTNASGVSVNSEDAGIVNNRFGSQTSVVPEPTSMALLGLGAIGMLGFRRRRKTLSQQGS